MIMQSMLKGLCHGCLVPLSYYYLQSHTTYYPRVRSLQGNVRPRPRPAPQLSIDCNMDVPKDVHYQLKRSLYMPLSQ